MPGLKLKARWVVPVSRPPIENGCITIEAGRIASVRQAVAADHDAQDLGDVVLLPGLVNAHTHLDLTLAAGRIPYRGSFTQWIRDVMSFTVLTAGDAARQQAMQDGARQSLAAGVTALADIGHGVIAAQQWRRMSMGVVGFLEVLGMGPRRQAAHPWSIDSAIDVCTQEPAATHVRLGLSPHAPYSTATSVYQQAVAFARSHGVPLCTHLAETREEARFLRDATGPFRELLETLGLWDGTFEPPGCSPVEYAKRLGLLDLSPLLAHVNYASDADLDLLAAARAHVAYCPRTHAFFQHAPHRYRDMLAREINVCIGTDSLASAPSLSVLDELRFLRSIDKYTSNNALLTLATAAGARTIGLEKEIGTLEVGKRADLVAVPLNNTAVRDPLDDLLGSQQEASHVYVAGVEQETVSS